MKKNYPIDMEFDFIPQRKGLGQNIAHSHAGIELHFCEAGEGLFQIGQITRKLKPGKITMIYAPAFHRVSADLSKEYCRTVINIPVDVAYRAVSVLGIEKDHTLPTQTSPIIQCTPMGRDFVDLRRVFRQIYRERRLENEQFTPKLFLYIAELFYISGRGVHKEKNWDQGMPYDHYLVERATSFAETDPRVDITVAELSAYVDVSPVKLWQAFDNVLATSPGQYLLERKMQRAKDWLLSSKSVTEVASMSGYSDIAAFSKAFKKHQGLSPSEFIRVCR